MDPQQPRRISNRSPPTAGRLPANRAKPEPAEAQPNASTRTQGRGNRKHQHLAAGTASRTGPARASRQGWHLSLPRATWHRIARRAALAAEKGIDLAGVTGSWPGGAIVLADVERAAGATQMRSTRTGSSASETGPRLRYRSHAAGHRCGNGPVQAGNSALLHDPGGRSSKATDWLARKNADVGPAEGC
jgi:pyruvate/2-oxoglutarate dehydrogenase complex dihydrolipoamide acyltransferase (E2) component